LKSSCSVSSLMTSFWNPQVLFPVSSLNSLSFSPVSCLLTSLSSQTPCSVSCTPCTQSPRFSAHSHSPHSIYFYRPFLPVQKPNQLTPGLPVLSQVIFTCKLYQTHCTVSAPATDNTSFILFPHLIQFNTKF
jgi:hypothetical protein